MVLLTRVPYDWGLRQGKYECYAEGRWFLRTLPLRARYTGYGTFDQLGPELGARLWKDQFEADLYERSTGWNEYHDLGSKKDHSLEALLETIHDGRLAVRRSECARGRSSKPSPPLPKTFPTERRVKKVLGDLPYRTIPVAVGQVVVRYLEPYGPEEKRTSWLQGARASLEAAGYSVRETSEYGDSYLAEQKFCSDLLVRPGGDFKSQLEAFYGARAYEEINARVQTRGGQKDRVADVLPITWAAFREDVWETFQEIKIPPSFGSKEKEPSLSKVVTFFKKSRALLSNEIERDLQHKKDLKEGLTRSEDESEAQFLSRQALWETLRKGSFAERSRTISEKYSFHVRDLAYQYELYDFANEVPYTLGRAYALTRLAEIANGDAPPPDKEIREVLKNAMELAHVNGLFAYLGRQWGPPSFVVSYDSEPVARDYFRAMHKLTVAQVKKNTEERRRWG